MSYYAQRLLRKFEDGLGKKDIQYYSFGMPETQIGVDALNKGVLIIDPVSTEVSALTTGITEQDNMRFDIIIGKSLRGNPANAQRETGAEFLVRIIEGRDNTGTLLTNTIRYILRSNIRTIALDQLGLSINYKDDRFNVEGAVGAVISFNLIDNTQQTIL